MDSFDTLRDQAGGLTDKADELVDSQADRIQQGADAAEGFTNDRTGGRFEGQIDTGIDQGLERLDQLDGRDDDFGQQPPTDEGQPDQQEIGENSVKNPDA